MLLEGQHFEHYHFLQLLGSGGMGDVYLAEDDRTGQQVAIKVIKMELGPYPGSSANEEAARLFLREAKAIAKLDHPLILPLYYYGETRLRDTSLVYLVMPYRPEGSLAAWMRDQYQQNLPAPQDVALIIRQAADALQHAHDKGVIHQDVKPSNFLLRKRPDDPTHPDLLLSDFGIARFMSTSSSASLTVRGTPTYMAPEQYRGEVVPASDQYALAGMAYELLVGRSVFVGNPVQMMYFHLNELPQPPSTINTRLPELVDAVLLTALAKDPARRFGSVTAFATAFQNALPRVTTPLSDHYAPRPSSASGWVAPRQLAEVEHEVTRISAGNHPTISAHQPGERNIGDIPTVISSTPNAGSGPAASPEFRANSSSPMAASGGVPQAADTPPSLPLTLIPGYASPTDPHPPHAALPPSGDKRKPGRLAFAGWRPGNIRRLTQILIVLVTILTLAGAGLATIVVLAKPASASSATVTISPQKKDVKTSFTIQAVTGTPGAGQVQARAVSKQGVSPRSGSTNATGQGQTSGAHASGTVRICNLDTISHHIKAGVLLSNDNPNGPNIRLSLTTTLTMTANNSGSCAGNWYYQTAVVNEVGTIGNVNPGQFFSYTPNPSSPYVYLEVYIPFAGGKDPVSYTYVQRSDITREANSLAADPPDPEQVLQDQLSSNERIIRGTQSCTPNVTSDHSAGDRAPTVTVTVSFTCHALVYDLNNAMTLVKSMFTDQEASALGQSYALVGQIVTTPEDATLDSQGVAELPVDVEGIWVYQFSEQAKLSLAEKLVNKPKQDAERQLLAMPGVSSVQIQLVGNNAQLLPKDASNIQIVVQQVQGL